MTATMLPSFHFGMDHQGFAAAWLSCPVYDDGRNIVLSEKIVLFLTVWLLRNLNQDGELYLRDGKIP